MRTTNRFILLSTLAFLLFVGPATAQELSIGADVVSRYVWRGFDLGESFSVQPTLEFSQGNFAIGSWASYSIAADGSLANEHDLYLSFAAGPVSFGVTDYYFPSPSTGEDFGFFNFDGDGEGAHIIEPFVSIGGTESLPVTLYAAVNVHNDPDNSVYLEVSYPFTVAGTDLGIALGVTPTESALYLSDGFALINVALSAGKEIKITDSFSLPVFASYILNPELERTYLVFGISL